MLLDHEGLKGFIQMHLSALLSDLMILLKHLLNNIDPPIWINSGKIAFNVKEGLQWKEKS